MAAPTPITNPLSEWADTVVRFPCMQANEVRLIVFDGSGIRRCETTCFRVDADDLALSLLRTIRELYPSPVAPGVSPLRLS